MDGPALLLMLFKVVTLRSTARDQATVRCGYVRLFGALAARHRILLTPWRIARKATLKVGQKELL